MKTILITPEYVPIESRWYLTYGKWYKISFIEESRLQHLVDDTEEELCVRIQGCSHLNWHRWLIKEDEPTPQVLHWSWYRILELSGLAISHPQSCTSWGFLSFQMAKGTIKFINLKREIKQ